MKTSPNYLSSIAALLSIAAIAIVGPPVQAQTYSTDFESPAFSAGLINAQDAWISANTNSRVLTSLEITNELVGAGLEPGATVHSGDQALIVSGGGASQNTTRTIGGGANYSKVTLDIWARPLGPRIDAASQGNIFLTMEDSGGNRAAAFRFGYDSATTNRHIDYADGAVGSAIWNSTGIAWDPTNTWYHIAMAVDYAAQTYDFFLNGAKINANPIAFYSGNFVKSFGQVRIFRGTSQAGMIVDDISISSVEGVAPAAILAASHPFGFKYRIFDVGTLTPDTNSITLTLDSASVAPTFVAQYGNIGAGDGTGLTVVGYDSGTPILATGSAHTNTIHFTGAGFSAVDKTSVFTVAPVVGTLDRTHHYLVRYQGNVLPRYSAWAEGRTGTAGDFSADMGNTPGSSTKIFGDDIDMLASINNAIANDTLTCSIWTKRRTMASSSIFWLNSPNAPVSGRAFQLHCPYSDNNVYFDTGGGTVPTSRLATNLAGLFDTAFWTNNWHHIVAIKNGSAKQVWIDGELIVEQTSGAASIAGYNDLNRLIIGAASPDSLAMNGLVDDVSIYSSALTPTDIAALFNGTAPNAIGASGDLLAWWDFNDGPGLNLVTAGNDAVVSFSQVLQSSTSVAGPFVDISTATSPYTNNINSNPQLFFRTRKY